MNAGQHVADSHGWRGSVVRTLQIEVRRNG
jgi:hypothetical protein